MERQIGWRELRSLQIAVADIAVPDRRPLAAGSAEEGCT